MKAIWAMAWVLAVAGCGSSGSGPAPGGTGGTAGMAAGATGGAAGATSCPAVLAAGTTATGTMSWKDNGALECAFIVLAVRTTATLADTIELDAVTASTPNLGVDIVLSSTTGLLGGTYQCQPGNGSQANVMFEVLGQKTSGFAAMSDCTVTIAFSTDSTGAQRAQGTFSGSVTGTGGADTVTDGTFDLSVTVNGG